MRRIVCLGVFLCVLSCALACDFYPIGVPKEKVSSGVWYGKDLGDIFEGSQPGNFGWLTWSGSPSAKVLEDSLKPPGDSQNYVNPDDPGDHKLSSGDWVRGKTGVSNSKKVRDALDVLRTVETVLPIWDQAAGNGANASYRVWAFARFRLLDYDLPKKKISVEFLWYEGCGEANSPPLVNAGTDQAIVAGSEAVLSGSVEDDGRPVWGEFSTSWAKVAGPGTVTFSDAGAASTRATFGGAGEYQLRLTGSDGELSASDEVTVTVNDPNRAPTAVAQSVSLKEDESVAVVLVGTDPDGDVLIFHITQSPAFGVLSGTAPNLTYTPVADYHGADEIAFEVSDGQLNSAPAVVSLTVSPVNDPPVADPVTATTPEDTPVAVVLSGGDIDGDPVSFRVTRQPANGSLSGNLPNLVYSPAGNFHGADSFEYVANDGTTDSAPGVVSLTISSENDAPVATAQDLETDEDVPLPVVLAASDADEDVLVFEIVTPPAHGEITGEAPDLSYTPSPDFHGSDEIRFRVSDGNGGEAEGIISITVHAVNDAPIAYAQAVELAEDTLANITLSAFDADGDSLTYLIATFPTNGGLAGAGENVIYIPFADFNGSDSFAFMVDDGHGGTSMATVAITVTPVNDAPSAEPQEVQVDAGGQVEITLIGNDPDGDPLTFAIVNPPTHGALSGQAPVLTYTPQFGFSGEDAFAFTVSDGQTTSAPAAATISVNYQANGRTYTSTSDFEEGQLVNLTTETPGEIRSEVSATSLDSVWVPVFDRGTVIRLDTETGRVLGEYRTAPETVATPYPSRTSVDSEGNVWIGNEGDQSVVMIANPEGDRWVDRNGNGVLDTSGGIHDVLGWTAADGAGGTSTAADELIVHYVKVSSDRVKHVSVDENDDVWVGGTPLANWDLVDSETGTIVRHESSVGYGGYGGFVDSDGVLWSAGNFLRWDTDVPLVSIDPEAFSPRPSGWWGIAKDSLGNVWVTRDGDPLVYKYSPQGVELGRYPHGAQWAQGIAIDANDHVWIAHSHCGWDVGHLLNDGTFVGNVPVAAHGPTAVAVDRKGRIWVSGTTGVVERINPLAGPLGEDGQTPVGQVDLSSTYLGGTPWTYSSFVGGADIERAQRGSWSVTFDAGFQGAGWEGLSWNGEICNDAELRVAVELSEDGTNFGPAQILTLENAVPTGTGRYIRITVDFLPGASGIPPVLKDLTVGTTGYPVPEATRFWRVDAGKDFQALWPDPIGMKGAVCRSPHAFPVKPGAGWSVVSGPGTVTFADPTDVATIIHFSQPGDYVLRLSGTLDGESQSDDVLVSLSPFNKSPWVNAGSTKYLADDSGTLQLDGIVRDDGLPENVLVQSEWTRKFGPGVATFTDPSDPETSVQFSAPGIYLLQLSATDSENAVADTMAVYAGALCKIEAPEGIVSWWQANCDGTDHISGNQAFLELGAGFVEGRVTAAFDFDGLNDRARVFSSPTLEMRDAPGLTLEFWVKADDILGNGTVIGWHDGIAAGVEVQQVRISSGNQAYYFQIPSVDGTTHTLVMDYAFATAGQWLHCALTYDKATGVARIYRDGALYRQQTLGTFEPRISGDLWFGSRGGTGSFFNGALDEISLYGRALDGSEIWEIYAAAEVGKCPPDTNQPPTVDAGPDLYLVGVSSSAQLKGGAVDDGLPSGSVLSFSWEVLAGPGPVTFQNASAAVTSATFGVEGHYLLRLSVNDSAALANDLVEVRVGQPCQAAVSDGLVAWWQGNGLPKDVVGGHDGLLNGGASFRIGRVLQAFDLDGNSDTVRVPGAQTLDLGKGDGFTIEFWANPDTVFNAGVLVGWNSGVEIQQVRIADRNYGYYFRLPDGSGTVHTLLMDHAFASEGAWHHFALTYDRLAGEAALYQDGVLFGRYAIGSFEMQTTGDLWFGSRGGLGAFFDGGLDEISLYSRALDGSEIWEIYAAGEVGKCPPDMNQPPVVNAGPDLYLAGISSTAQLQGGAVDDGLPSGSALSFSWEALAGPGPVTFQNASAAVTTATFGVEGHYLLRLSVNDSAVLASDLVEVRVGQPCQVDTSDGLVAWWQGNGLPNDVVGGHDGLLNGGVSFRVGKVLQAFDFDGTSDTMRVPGADTLDVGKGDGFTIEFWTNPDTVFNSGILLGWNSGVEIQQIRIADQNYGYFFRLPDVSGTVHTLLMDHAFAAAGAWHHFALTYDRLAGEAHLYRDGVLFGRYAIGSFEVRTTGDLWIGSRTGLAPFFDGGLDEISLYNRALDGSEIWDIYAADNVGKCPPNGNHPPAVNAGPDLRLSNVTDVAQLMGAAVDDGNPAGSVLQIRWEMLSGPGVVTFGDENALATTAVFDAEGIYLLRLSVSDLAAIGRDIVEVRVGSSAETVPPADLVGWWPANGLPADLVNGNHGLLNGGVLYAPGVVAQAFEFDGSSDTVRVPAAEVLDVGAGPGLTVEFWANAHNIFGSGVVWGWNDGTYGVGIQQGRIADQNYGYLFRLPSNDGSAHDLLMDHAFVGGGEWHHFAVTYDVASGIASLYRDGALWWEYNLGSFQPKTSGDLWMGSERAIGRFFDGDLDELSIYRRALSSAEIAAIYSAGSSGKKSPNQAPSVFAGFNQTITLPQSADLFGLVGDDGLPAGNALSVLWSVVNGSGPVTFGPADSVVSTATFSLPGVYELRLTASDGELSGESSLIVTVQAEPVPPVVEIDSPVENQRFAEGTTITVTAMASDPDGTVARIDFAVDGAEFARIGTPPYAANLSGLSTGTHILTATAIDDDGLTSTSLPVTIEVRDVSNSGSPTAGISQPQEGATITAPTEIVGTADGDNFQSYTLQYRRKDAPCSNWVTFAGGIGEVTDDVLGTLDPTLLINGIYEIQLAVTALTGETYVVDSTVVVDGGMKVGNFTVAFNDLTVPLAGLPVTVTRTYDSRDACPGDFGRGWNLDVSTVRVEKTNDLGENWYYDIDPPPDGNPFVVHYYAIVDDGSHVVNVRFPDGTLQRFRPVLRVKNTGANASDYRPYVPYTTGDEFVFTMEPLAGTQGTLTPLGVPPALHMADQSMGSVAFTPEEFGSEVFAAATGWVYTAQDGKTFRFDAAGVLTRMSDRNGNSLTFNDGGIFHSSGESVTFTRDAEGRITKITDPRGNDLHYVYAPNGNLDCSWERVTPYPGPPTVRYYYKGETHLLDRVVSAGTQALRNEYDDAGRLVKTIDADGNETIFTHDVNGRTETIRDRKGNVTVHRYDERGNVTETVTPDGTRTATTYHVWSDGTKSDLKSAESVTGLFTNDAGQLVSKTVTMTYSYEDDDPVTPPANDGLLRKLVDPLGNTITFIYDGNGNVLTIKDARGGTTVNTYYSGTNLIHTTTDAAGSVTAFTYDAQGNLDTETRTVTVVDAAGASTVQTLVTDHDYDALGRLEQVTDPLGHITTYEYDANGNRTFARTTRTDSTGATHQVDVENEYDANDRLVKTWDAEHPRSSNPTPTGEIVYNALGQPWKTYDALRRVTEQLYNSRGELERTIYPDGTSESVQYDAEGRQEFSTDRRGRVTQYVYDSLGRVTSTLFHGDASVVTLSSVHYDAAGHVWQSADANGHTTTNVYDDAGRRVAMIDALGQRTDYDYDENGNLRFFTDAKGNVTEYAYDDLNRRVRTIYPVSEVWTGGGYQTVATDTTTGYDELGRRVRETDQSGKITRYVYDALGRLTDVVDPLGQLTRYGYDELGNQLTQTDANSHTTSYDYDSIGRRTGRRLPLGQEEFAQYDDAGNLRFRTDFNGKTTEFQYDAMNRLRFRIADVSFGEASVEWTYTASGRRETMTDPSGTTTYFYDDRDRLETIQRPEGSLGYTYDDVGNLKSIASSTPDGAAMIYTYDALNRLDTVTDVNGELTDYGYDANGNLQGVLLPNGITSSYVYNSVNRLTSLYHTKSLATVASYTHGLHPTGHRRRVVEHTGRDATYTYDDLWRLRSETVTGDPDGKNGGVTYALDPVGNRTGRTSTVAGLVSQTFSYDANDRVNGDTYDNNGNTLGGAASQPPSTGTGGTDTYDSQNRLIRRVGAINNQPSTINILYNGDGHKVRETVTTGGITTTTIYLVDELNPTGYAQVVEEHTNGVPTRIYTYGHDLISMDQLDGSATWHLSYYGYDGHGSVRFLTDDQGAVTDTYTYDAFGELLSSSGTTANLYRYCGEQFSPNLGLYYLRARYLNSATGLFWSMDAYEGLRGDPLSLHKYAYANADAVNWIDPSGYYSTVELSLANTIAGTITSMQSRAGIDTFDRAVRALNPASDSALVTDVYLLLADVQLASDVYTAINLSILLKHVYQWGSSKILDLLSRSYPTRAGPRITPRIAYGNTLDDNLRMVQNSPSAQTTGPRAFYVGPEARAASIAAGDSVIQLSDDALAALRAGDKTLARAESIRWAESATGKVNVRLSPGVRIDQTTKSIFFDNELPILVAKPDVRINWVDISGKL